MKTKVIEVLTPGPSDGNHIGAEPIIELPVALTWLADTPSPLAYAYLSTDQALTLAEELLYQLRWTRNVQREQQEHLTTEPAE